MKKEALEDHLGAVLERSWLVLGAVLGAFWGVLCWKTCYFVKKAVFENNVLRVNALVFNNVRFLLRYKFSPLSNGITLHI